MKEIKELEMNLANGFLSRSEDLEKCVKVVESYATEETKDLKMVCAYLSDLAQRFKDLSSI